MAGSTTKISTGLTLAAGTSAWSARLTDISIDGIKRDEIETTYLGTAAPSANTFGNRTFIPKLLSNGGAMKVQFQYNPDTLPPIDAVAETWTITYRTETGDMTGSILAFSGFATDFSISNNGPDGMAMGEMTVKVTGPVTRTAAT